MKIFTVISTAVREDCTLLVTLLSLLERELSSVVHYKKVMARLLVSIKAYWL